MNDRILLWTLVAAVAVLGPVACDSKTDQQDVQTHQTEPPMNDEQTPDSQDTPAADPGPPVVVMETSKGAITIELNPDKAPVTVENFLGYVDQGAYDGLIFHRVIPGFMIQGGGFDPDMNQRRSGETIRNEADNGLQNERGTIAMARTSDPHSASNQFFINLADNDFLDHSGKNPQGWGYCVFGRVVDGMDVVDAIATVKTTTRGMHENVPVEPVMIESVKRK
jgi:peptidyl-prolyl cis-trans isomerase B (cyclophilin B)